MFNLTVAEAHTFFVGTNGWLVHNCPEWEGVFATDDMNHVLYGTGTRPGGGHLWPGKDGKTSFPQTWDADKIMSEVADIITSKETKWYSPDRRNSLDKPARLVNNSDEPAFFVAWEIRDGVRMRVVWRPLDQKLITATPDDLPITKLYYPVKNPTW